MGKDPSFTAYKFHGSDHFPAVDVAIINDAMVLDVPRFPVTHFETVYALNKGYTPAAMERNKGPTSNNFKLTPRIRAMPA